MAYTGQKKIDYQLSWMAKRKQEYMNKYGPCIFCGTSGKLEIHHVDADQKVSHKIWSWSKERIEHELLGCVIICRDCHIKFHSLEKRKVEHGKLNTYEKYKCRCPKCRAVKSEAMRKYRNSFKLQQV